MRHHKEKWSELGKKAVSVLLCASMVVPFVLGSSSQPEVASEENGEMASGVMTLAAKKEAQTGEVGAFAWAELSEIGYVP